MLEVQDVCDATAEIEKSTAAIEKSNKSLLVTLNEKVGRYKLLQIFTIEFKLEYDLEFFLKKKFF